MSSSNRPCPQPFLGSAVACTSGVLGLAVLLAVVPWPSHAENWPQWRGPLLNGSTTETGLPSTWSKTEGVKWVAPMPGRSPSTPVIWGDRVFVTSVDRSSNSLVALCLDSGSGAAAWKQTAGENQRAKGNNTMAAPSPVTDGQSVAFLFGTGVLLACDFEGNLLWRRDLAADYGAFVVKWGYSSSPLLYDGRLYVLLMQNEKPDRYGVSDRTGPLESFLLAVDLKTGRDLWRHVRETDATDESTESYSTPVPYEHAGRKEIIVVGGEFVTGHAAATGAETWRWEFSPPDRQIWQRTVASPVVGGGLVYAVRPKHRPMFALRLGGRGRLTDDCVAWKLTGFTPDVCNPLLYGGRLYALDGDQRVMTCLDAKTGKQVWQGHIGGRAVYRASPTGADGRIYCINEAGGVIVVSAEDEFRILSRIAMGEQPCQSTIVASGGRLYIRTAKNLYCVGE